MSKGMLLGAGGALAVAGGFAAMTSHAVESLAALQDMSDTTGLSTDAIQSMKPALDASNMNVQQYADTISKLNIKLGENSAYWKSQKVDVTDSAKAFDQIKHKIADIEDPIKRAEIANKAFGKSYKDLMPLLTMDNNSFDSAKSGATIFSKQMIENAARVDDKVAALKTTFSDFSVSIGTKFIPAMEYLIDLFQESAEFWSNAPNPNDYGTEGIKVKTNQGARVTEQDLSSKNFNSTEAQKQLAEMDSKRLMELSVWASTQKQDNELASQLLKVRKDRLKTEAATEEANRKSLEQSRLNQAKADELAASQERLKNLLEQTSYSTFLQNQRENSLKETRNLENQHRFDQENSQTVDFFGGNDTAFRDFQEQENNKKLQSFMSEKHKESLANSDNSEGNAAHEAQVQADLIQKQNEGLEKQAKLYDEIGSSISGLVEDQLKGMYQTILQGNFSAKSTFESFGESALNTISQIAAKATILGIGNLLTGGTLSAGTGGLGILSSVLGFANGTNYAPGGYSTWAERGPEIVNGRLYTQQTYGNLPRGSAVTPLEKVVNNNSPTSITINNYDSKMTDRDLARAVSRRSKEYGAFA